MELSRVSKGMYCEGIPKNRSLSFRQYVIYHWLPIDCKSLILLKFQQLSNIGAAHGWCAMVHPVQNKLDNALTIVCIQEYFCPLSRNLRNSSLDATTMSLWQTYSIKLHPPLFVGSLDSRTSEEHVSTNWTIVTIAHKRRTIQEAVSLIFSGIFTFGKICLVLWYEVVGNSHDPIFWQAWGLQLWTNYVQRVLAAISTCKLWSVSRFSFSAAPKASTDICLLTYSNWVILLVHLPSCLLLYCASLLFALESPWFW